jgi:pimeloyl-ACP methyl ester carboxylesterase
VEEVAFGPGAWENELPPAVRATFVRNAPTFLDELQDPTQLSIDKDALAHLEIPVHVTEGSESPPVFIRVIDRLVDLIPRVTRETIQGTTHGSHLTTPERYIAIITRTVQQSAAA